MAGSFKSTTLAFEDSKFSSLSSPLGSRFLRSTSTTRKYGSNNFSYIHEALTILTWKTCALLNSVQKFIEIQSWLLLTFFICLHNQLSSFNSIIVPRILERASTSRSYRCLKNVIHQIDSKNEWLLLSVTFTAKLKLVFILTFKTIFLKVFILQPTVKA